MGVVSVRLNITELKRRVSTAAASVFKKIEITWVTDKYDIPRYNGGPYCSHNDFLDWFGPGASKHPVFGQVVSGMDVVNAIGKTKTDRGDNPVTPVLMKSVKIK